MHSLKRLAIQTRGIVTIVVVSPVTAAAVGAALLVGVFSRNLPGFHGAGAQSGVLHVADFLVRGYWSASTLAGLALAAAAFSMLRTVDQAARSAGLLEILEPSAARRVATESIGVILLMNAFALLSFVAMVGAQIVQLKRLGHVEIDFHLNALQAESIARSLLVICSFAVAVGLLSDLVSSQPVALIGFVIGFALVSMMLQQLMAGVGDIVTPSAVVGRWLHLPGTDQGITYFWTVGSFDSGQPQAGVAIAAITSICVALRIAVSNRRLGVVVGGQ